MIGGDINPADIPRRVCNVKDFDHCFQGPALLFQIKFNFEEFDATERRML